MLIGQNKKARVFQCKALKIYDFACKALPTF